MQTDFFLACPVLGAICVRMETSLLKTWAAGFELITDGFERIALCAGRGKMLLGRKFHLKPYYVC